MDAEQIWDDVIVGAGSAGAVLASRLSEQPGRRVLLLEAGPDFPHLDQVPVEISDARTPVMSGYNWDLMANLRSSGLLENLLQSVAVATAAPADMFAAAKAVLRSSQPLAAALQQFPYAVGKIVGGSSAVNGALALRGLAEDFERWAALGNAEWCWEQVLPYFKKIETDLDFQNETHGNNGPLLITRSKKQHWHELQAAFYEACRALGLTDIPDFNASSAIGVGAAPTNSVHQVRISTASAYLASARVRPNLAIRADCQASRVLFNGLNAVGVGLLDEYGKPQRVFGKRITLCAGAINTIPLLLRSGIGNNRLCRSLGISPVMDLPGVGENLADHAAVIMWMTPKAGVCQEGEPYHQIMARAASSSSESPDLTLFMLSNVITDKVPMLSQFMHVPLVSGISVMLAKPESRGRVFLESAAPGSKPVIELNFLSAQGDIERLMHGMRLAWKIAQSQPLAERTDSIFMWTDSMINNDSFLKSAIKRFVGATWHATGTARMGPKTDPMAVVDQHCRVHGVENLRVVDASVMPQIPAAATNLTCIMLAERAAEWMKEGA